MKYKKRIVSVVFLLIYNISYSQTGALHKDFKSIMGCWKGTLTYLDYTSNKAYTMPAKLDISLIDKKNKFSFANSYPDEPQANSIDTILIIPKGNYINKEIVRSKRKLNDGNLEIITEASGPDGNDDKQAIFRYTYILGKNKYSHTKEVRFAGTSAWIKRHEYNYTRCSK